MREITLGELGIGDLCVRTLHALGTRALPGECESMTHLLVRCVQEPCIDVVRLLYRCTESISPAIMVTQPTLISSAR